MWDENTCRGERCCLGRWISLETEAGLVFTADGMFLSTTPNVRLHFGLIAALTQATFSYVDPVS